MFESCHPDHGTGRSNAVIGIYKIQNKLNSKCYIGQSINIHKRWIAHKTASFNPKSHNYNSHFYRAIRKYGLDAFDFSVLEECDAAELNRKEQQYIEQYNAYFDGYNETFGGDSSGARLPKEHIIGIIRDLENTTTPHKEIAQKWGVCIDMVQGINTGRYHKHNRDYPIQTQHRMNMINKHDTVKYCIDCGAQIWYTSTRCPSCARQQRKQHSTSKCPDKDTLLTQLTQFQNFTAIAKIYNVSDNAVRKWCRQLGLPDKTSAYKPATAPKTKIRNIQIRPIHMLDIETNEVLQTFPSISEAEKYVRGRVTGAIQRVLKGGRPTAYGYKWAYADETPNT